MKCVYSGFFITCRCPENTSVVDYYDISIESDKMILVEFILATVKDFSERIMYQEHLTEELAIRFGAGVTITTTGFHSKIKTVVTVEGR